MSKKRRELGTPAIDVSVLLDRTGSMASHWLETLTAVNAYCRQVLTDTSIDARIRVVVFDHWISGTAIDVVRHWTKETWEDIDEKERDWVDINSSEVSPRGNTPLYEATGRVLTGLLADKRKPETRVQLVIMTDGQENSSSRDWPKSRISELIKGCEQNNGWQIIFLGANLDTWVGTDMGTQLGTTMTYTPDTLHSMNAFAAVARSTQAYGLSGQSAGFTSQERNDALQQQLHQLHQQAQVPPAGAPPAPAQAPTTSDDTR